MVNPTPLNTSWGNYSNPMARNALAADPDIVLSVPEALAVDLQAELILQDIGGIELITMSRHDTVNGQNVVYQPFKDVDTLAIEYSPLVITGFSPTLKQYKSTFSIQIDEKQTEAPEITGSIYVDTEVSGTASNIVVELENLAESDNIEIAFSLPEKVDYFSTQTAIVFGGDVVGAFDGEVDGGNSLGYNIDITTNGGGA